MSCFKFLLRHGISWCASMHTVLPRVACTPPILLACTPLVPLFPRCRWKERSLPSLALSCLRVLGSWPTPGAQLATAGLRPSYWRRSGRLEPSWHEMVGLAQRALRSQERREVGPCPTLLGPAGCGQRLPLALRWNLRCQPHQCSLCKVRVVRGLVQRMTVCWFQLRGRTGSGSWSIRTPCPWNEGALMRGRTGSGSGSWSIWTNSPCPWNEGCSLRCPRFPRPFDSCTVGDGRRSRSQYCL